MYPEQPLVQGASGASGDGRAYSVMTQIKLEKNRSESVEMGLQARRKQVRASGLRGSTCTYPRHDVACLLYISPVLTCA